jgi:hypothetical protein
MIEKCQYTIVDVVDKHTGEKSKWAYRIGREVEVSVAIMGRPIMFTYPDQVRYFHTTSLTEIVTRDDIIELHSRNTMYAIKKVQVY